MSDAPLPCPFCGSDRVSIGSNETKESYPTEWFVACDMCFSRGPTEDCGEDEFGALRNIKDKYEALAVAAWNRRRRGGDRPMSDDAEMDAGMTSYMIKALWKAIHEAHWQRGILSDSYASEEQMEMSIASVIAAFLESVPTSIDAGTLLAEVKKIASG